MARVHRFGAALALAGVLGIGLMSTPTALSAAPTGFTPQVTQACERLARAIALLESKRATHPHLVAFLLDKLRNAQLEYCA